MAYVHTDALVQLNTARFNLYLRCRNLRELPPQSLLSTDTLSAVPAGFGEIHFSKNAFHLFVTLDGRLIPLGD